MFLTERNRSSLWHNLNRETSLENRKWKWAWQCWWSTPPNFWSVFNSALDSAINRYKLPASCNQWSLPLQDTYMFMVPKPPQKHKYPTPPLLAGRVKQQRQDVDAEHCQNSFDFKCSEFERVRKWIWNSCSCTLDPWHVKHPPNIEMGVHTASTFFHEHFNYIGKSW